MQKFLAALEEAGYEREDNPAQAVLLRELVNSLSSGKLLHPNQSPPPQG